MPITINKADLDWDTLLKEANKSVLKLIIIVGPSGSGKSCMLNNALNTDFTLMNVGKELSRDLVQKTDKSQVSEAEETMMSIIRDKSPKNLALDNTEILFEYPLKLNPLKLMKRISQNTLTIATWNGDCTEDMLVYGNRNYGTFKEFKYSQQDSFIVVPTIELAA